MSKDLQDKKIKDEDSSSGNDVDESKDEKLEEDNPAASLDENEGEDEKENAEVEQQEEVKEEIDWQDKYMRLHADWENYRKRMDEQRADERVRANEKLMSELIPLPDDMNHALDYAAKNGEKDLLDGFKQICTKFVSSLEKHGLEEINPEGEPFDPIFHQAVGTVEDKEAFEETIKDVYQKGYRLGRKVLRPAMVTYTVGGKKRESDEEEE